MARHEPRVAPPSKAMKRLSKDELIWLDRKLDEADRAYYKYWDTYRKGQRKKPYHLNYSEYEYLYILDAWTLGCEPPTYDEWFILEDLIARASLACIEYGMITKLPTKQFRDDIWTGYILNHWT